MLELYDGTTYVNVWNKAKLVFLSPKNDYRPQRKHRRMSKKRRMTPDRWLYLLATNLRPYFRDAGYPLPPNIELRCGFPESRRAAGSAYHGSQHRRKRALAK